MATVNRKWYSGMLSQEDWWAVWMGIVSLFSGIIIFGGPWTWSDGRPIPVPGSSIL